MIKLRAFLEPSQNPRYYQRSLPWVLLALTILAYGLLLRQLGYYWDDWPWVWFFHQQGAGRLLSIDQVSRPLAGEILWLGAILAGENPLGWQALNLLYRWLSALALAWMLVKLWPGRLERAAWMALLFLIYPGFRQQFISINSSRHILPLAVTFLSIGCMLWAVRAYHDAGTPATRASRQAYGLRTGMALALMVVGMLATEYYYGLELIRWAFVWLALEAVANPSRRIKLAVVNWLPYLAVLSGVFAWRYAVSPRGNYPIVMTDQLAEQPVATVIDVMERSGQAFFSAVILAWKNLVDVELIGSLGLRIPFVAGLLAVGVLVGVAIYLWRGTPDRAQGGFSRQAVLLGTLAVLAGVLPFLVTGLEVGLDFPADRTTLAFMFGAVLILVGMIDWLGQRRWIKISVVAGVVGLGVGSGFLTAAQYAQDWRVQQSFFQQLSTRVPGIESGTAVIYEYSLALRDLRSTDNSLRAPLNWMYAPDFSGRRMPYNLVDLRTRYEYWPENFEQNPRATEEYGEYFFTSDPDKILALQFAPPGCLSVLDARQAGLVPDLPDRLAEMQARSNPGLIDRMATPPAWLGAVFGAQHAPDWCIFYQQAALAAQFGDWQRVVQIGETAFKDSDPPRRAVERLPFILGYGYTGDWARAEQLTWETSRRDANAYKLLCAAWVELGEKSPYAVDADADIADVLTRLNCDRP